MDYDLLSALQNLYGQMDQSSQAFQQKSGLHCRPQCGRCCQNPEVESTPFEMLPMAYKLYQEEEWQQWMEKLQVSVALGESPCLMYQAHPHHPHQGKCTQYQVRPTLCRIFGYMAVQDKQQRKKLSVCKYIKEDRQDFISWQEQVEADPQFMAAAPLLTHWVNQVQSLHGNAADHQRMPINRALLLALGHLANYLSYQDLAKEVGKEF